MSLEKFSNRRPLRIAVSGAHGVGKTTFCLDLARALEPLKIDVVKDVARGLNAEGVPINQDTQESQYALFFERHLRNLSRLTEADVVIFDRTLIDSIGYGVANGNLSEPWIRFAKATASHILPIIDAYFFIRIEFALFDDGVRHMDAIYQQQLDAAIHAVLQDCHVKFSILSGTPSQRVAQALEVIMKDHGSPALRTCR